MNNDEKFINDVWFKYNSYKQYIVKDTFFKKHHYKNNNIKRYLHATISFGFSIIITVGIVYASTKGFDFNQKNATIDYVEHIGQDYNQEMQCSNGIYYTKIYNYADYIKAKEIYSGLLEMEQQDFENNFLLILAGENYDTTNLYISNTILSINGKL